MQEPSYTELMEIINEDKEKGSEVTSRYSIVLVAAKRARQLIEGEKATVDSDIEKPLSIAIKEMQKKHLVIELKTKITEIID